MSIPKYQSFGIHKILQKTKPHCPNCGTLADGASGQGSTGPQPGSLCVCYYCFGLSEYIDTPGGLALRAFTDAEIDALHPDNKREILDLIKHLKKGRGIS